MYAYYLEIYPDTLSFLSYMKIKDDMMPTETDFLVEVHGTCSIP